MLLPPQVPLSPTVDDHRPDSFEDEEVGQQDNDDDHPGIWHVLKEVQGKQVWRLFGSFPELGRFCMVRILAGLNECLFLVHFYTVWINVSQPLNVFCQDANFVPFNFLILWSFSKYFNFYQNVLVKWNDSRKKLLWDFLYKTNLLSHCFFAYCVR